METVKLNNEVEMPLLGFGTFQVSDKAECIKSVETALKTGYRLIDTAQAYGNEEAVGEGIRNSGVKREDIFLTTKVWFRSFESGDCKNSVYESMRKLQVEYLDLVLLHWPFGNTYSAWRDLEELYGEGKIRAIGISNFEPAMIVDFVNFNKVVPTVNQIETHLFCQRKAEHKNMEKYGIAHQAYAPLGQGRANEMFAKTEVQSLAEKYGKTPAQVLLRFLTQCQVSVIPKSVHEERIKENFNIFDFKLDNAELDLLRALDTATAMIGNPYNPELVESAMKW